ncbi:MAG: tyrosine-protein phosphatase [Candidatus Liptonbacteria bacterium]|nr:tyrosine-protein phosphatase [Candidatus Liptonbacteria bacterium]
MRKAVKRLCWFFTTFALIVALSLAYQPNPKRDEPTVAIVFGYHFLLEKNSAKRNYAWQVKNILDSFSDVRFIVVSGGKTKPESSHYSEAANMKMELERIGVKIPIILEENALSTEQNVRFSEDTIRRMENALPRNSRVIIFCDKIRRQAVWWHVIDNFRSHRVSVFGIPLWKERISYSQETRTLRYRDEQNRHNFGVVDPGKLYRSAQPSTKFLEALARDHGVKTVINLRGETLNSEKMAAERLDLNMIEIPMSANESPTGAAVERFLAIAEDPKYQPVLLHCRAGSDRTGLLAAIYRMRVQRWRREDALAEMKRYGYLKFMHPRLIKNISEVTQCAK